MNPQLEIKVDGYNLIVANSSGKVIVLYIKTNRQRKYRGLIDFYYEKTGIKENQVDRMLMAYGRNNSLEERFKEQEKKLAELGIDKKEIIEAYRREYINHVKNFNFEWGGRFRNESKSKIFIQYN